VSRQPLVEHPAAIGGATNIWIVKYNAVFLNEPWYHEKSLRTRQSTLLSDFWCFMPNTLYKMLFYYSLSSMFFYYVCLHNKFPCLQAIAKSFCDSSLYIKNVWIIVNMMFKEVLNCEYCGGFPSFLRGDMRWESERDGQNETHVPCTVARGQVFAQLSDGALIDFFWLICSLRATQHAWLIAPP